jgi:hypothetical protein
MPSTPAPGATRGRYFAAMSRRQHARSLSRSARVNPEAYDPYRHLCSA